MRNKINRKEIVYGNFNNDNTGCGRVYFTGSKKDKPHGARALADFTLHAVYVNWRDVGAGGDWECVSGRDRACENWGSV